MLTRGLNQYNKRFSKVYFFFICNIIFRRGLSHDKNKFSSMYSKYYCQNQCPTIICHTRPTTHTQRTITPECQSFQCKTAWFTGKCGLVPVELNPRNYHHHHPWLTRNSVGRATEYEIPEVVGSIPAEIKYCFLFVVWSPC